MPRSATDRSFGFKAGGLLRILTAADPQEVLEAMEALGIIIEHEHDPPPPANSSAKLAEAESLLSGLVSLADAMESVEGNLHRTARSFTANRTRAQANLDVLTLDGLDGIYDDLKGQYDDFTQILSFILRLFTQNAIAFEERIEEETVTTTTI